MADDRVSKVALKAFKLAGDAMGAGALTSVFDEHKGRDVVVPPDLHLAKLPPVAADGTAECWRCRQRLPFAKLEITGDTYACGPCVLRAAQVAAAHAPVDTDVVIGRGRWWLVPSIIVAMLVIALVIITSYRW